MRTILDTIAEYTQHRIEEEKKNISTQAMRRQAEEIYRQESAAGNDMQNENDVNDVMYGKQAIAEHFSFERELARRKSRLYVSARRLHRRRDLSHRIFHILT